MPCYDYKCMECGYISQHIHNIHIKLRNVCCPHCYQWARVKRLVYTPAIILKGPRWERDGYQGEKTDA